MEGSVVRPQRKRACQDFRLDRPNRCGGTISGRGGVVDQQCFSTARPEAKVPWWASFGLSPSLGSTFPSN